jgi:hypothetical protein
MTIGDQVVQSIQQKTTEDLLSIWVSNDRDQWTDKAFEAIYLTLTERGVDIPEQRPLAPVLPRYKGVRGWLLFFCISLTILNPLGLFSELGRQGKTLVTSSVFDWLLITISGFGIYAGVLLWRVAPGAVKMAKAFLWTQLIFFVILALVLITPHFLSSGNAVSDVGQIVVIIMRSAGYFLIWYLYLNRSIRVKATYDYSTLHQKMAEG